MKFAKMHGLGNCYVYVNCFSEPVADAVTLARRMSDRNTGVGSDGLILICPSRVADVRMEMYNMDGSRGQMCGNGIRCLAKYVYDRGLARRNPLRVETDAGVLTLELSIENGHVSLVRVDMGEPRLRPEDLPVRLPQDQMINRPIEVLGRLAKMTCVSMGNPHVVVYGVPLKLLEERDVSVRRLEIEGRRIEIDPLFPERTNVHFVEVHNPAEAAILHWERGSGATQACGTGACAVGVAGVLAGRSGRKITAHLPGGDLDIEWSQSDNHVHMTGPAVEIFSGEWNESL
ncbi:MAG TPA: diaminopimelate epimerase [Phycisphaerae bacterium]|nr:diaminopimelate epimerase [Phycisphaerae bacterium]